MSLVLYDCLLHSIETDPAPEAVAEVEAAVEEAVEEVVEEVKPKRVPKNRKEINGDGVNGDIR